MVVRYFAPGVALVVGLWHVVTPGSVWRLRRGAGAAAPRTLRRIRLQGSAFLVFAAIWFVLGQRAADEAGPPPAPPTHERR